MNLVGMLYDAPKAVVKLAGPKCGAFALAGMTVMRDGFAFHNASVIGGVAGVCLGLANRFFTEMPDSLKISSKARKPFPLPILTLVNRGMSIYMHTPLKYLPLLACLGVMSYEAVRAARAKDKANDGSTPLLGHLRNYFTTDEGRKVLGKVALAIGMTASSALMASTKDLWSPLLSRVLGEDPSGHVMMSSGLGMSLSLLGQVAAETGMTKTAKVISAISVLQGIGNGVMLTHTAAYYHTVADLTGGFACVNFARELLPFIASKIF